MRDADRRGTAWADWLAAATALLGGSLLLSARHRRSVAEPAPEAGEITLDDSARHGRGHAHAPPRREVLQLGYETHDANAGFVARIMAGLAVVALGCVLAMVSLLALFHRQLQADRPTYTAEQSARIDPPRPQLEAHPETDLQREAAGEAVLLDSYAWADAAHSRARIPIARAMALTVGRTLDPAP